MVVVSSSSSSSAPPPPPVLSFNTFVRIKFSQSLGFWCTPDEQLLFSLTLGEYKSPTHHMIIVSASVSSVGWGWRRWTLNIVGKTFKRMSFLFRLCGSLTLAACTVKHPSFLAHTDFAYCCYCIWCSWLFMAVDFQQTIPKSCITTAINLLILYGVLLWHLNKIILNKLILWFLCIFCRSVSLMCITHHKHSVREWMKER